MAIELTAQLYPFCNRLCEFGAVDLAFVMRRDQTIEELIVTCDAGVGFTGVSALVRASSLVINSAWLGP